MTTKVRGVIFGRRSPLYGVSFACLFTMGKLTLNGMRASCDEIISMALKRPHEPQQVVGDLLTSEVSENQARSIKYQLTIAKLPLA